MVVWMLKVVIRTILNMLPVFIFYVYGPWAICLLFNKLPIYTQKETPHGHASFHKLLVENGCIVNGIDMLDVVQTLLYTQNRVSTLSIMYWRTVIEFTIDFAYVLLQYIYLIVLTGRYNNNTNSLKHIGNGAIPIEQC